MRAKFRKIAGTPKNEFPINPTVIPNAMGINLCSVAGMSWVRQNDGQLLTLTIHFIPEAKGDK